MRTDKVLNPKKPVFCRMSAPSDCIMGRSVYTENMQEEITLREIELRYEREALEAFLVSHSLRFEQDIETAFGLFSEEEELLGCGCAAGNLLKCFAVAEELRGRNALGTLASALIQDRFSKNITDLFVITKAANEPLFTGCGFYTLAKTGRIAMLENRKNGPERFLAGLMLPGDEGKRTGAAVMNCNPFTRGHRYLIETAAKECDILYVFVVKEERSAFPFSDRFRLVCEGTADIPNVRVHKSGPYMISAATFPTYFLKKEDDADILRGELDAVLFAERIAPALHITRRFVGTEPIDAVTAGYNLTLKRLLPAHGIEVREIPRLKEEETVISASAVRELLRKKDWEALRALVPDVTFRYLRERAL